MTINITENMGNLNVKLAGRLDTTTAPELEAALSKYIDFTNIDFDFTALEYISSAGLRILLSVQKTVNAAKGKMIVHHVSESIMEVFEITGFADILTIE